MRLLRNFLVLCIFISAGCSVPLLAQAPSPSQPTLDPSPPSARVVTDTQAAAVGQKLLEMGGTRWLDAPRALFAKEMSLRDAHQYLPMLGESPDVSPNMLVWLVVYQGRWQLMPYGRTQGAPAPTVYEGCGFVLLKASDGSFMAAGDSACPGQN